MRSGFAVFEVLMPEPEPGGIQSDFAIVPRERDGRRYVTAHIRGYETDDQTELSLAELKELRDEAAALVEWLAALRESKECTFRGSVAEVADSLPTSPETDREVGRWLDRDEEWDEIPNLEGSES